MIYSTPEGQTAREKVTTSPPPAPDHTLTLDIRPLSDRTGKCLVGLMFGREILSTHTISSIFSEKCRLRLASTLCELGVVGALDELEAAARWLWCHHD